MNKGFFFFFLWCKDEVEANPNDLSRPHVQSNYRTRALKEPLGVPQGLLGDIEVNINQ